MKPSEMWAPHIRQLVSELEAILAQADGSGSDGVSGGRAAVIEMWMADLAQKVKDLGDELRFHDLTFEPIVVENTKNTKYVVCRRGNKLVFLLGQDSGENGDGHLLIVERNGFKKEDCLGGGFVTIDCKEYEVILQGRSTSLGPNLVHQKTFDALMGAISRQED